MGAGPGIGAEVSPRPAARGTRMALLDLDATAVCAETSECPGAVALVNKASPWSGPSDVRRTRSQPRSAGVDPLGGRDSAGFGRMHCFSQSAAVQNATW